MKDIWIRKKEGIELVGCEGYMLIIDGVVDIAVYEGCSSFIYVDDDEDAGRASRNR